ncbi:hypothetical protein FXO37_33350 [Capsicum annuum]|nr:hypothetical protein FXO37_33350 [Capsicum annuum]
MEVVRSKLKAKGYIIYVGTIDFQFKEGKSGLSFNKDTENDIGSVDRASKNIEDAPPFDQPTVHTSSPPTVEPTAHTSPCFVQSTAHISSLPTDQPNAHVSSSPTDQPTAHVSSPIVVAPNSAITDEEDEVEQVEHRDKARRRKKAVVEIKNKTTWSCFIRIVKEDLQLGDGTDLTVIPDMQKGLEIAITEYLSNAKHRMCARHVLANWSKDAICRVAALNHQKLDPVNYTSHWKMSGRPEKNRKKEKGETKKKTRKFSKMGIEISCGTCHSKGHNKRRCPTGAPAAGTNANSGPNSPASVEPSAGPSATPTIGKERGSTRRERGIPSKNSTTKCADRPRVIGMGLLHTQSGCTILNPEMSSERFKTANCKFIAAEICVYACAAAMTAFSVVMLYTNCSTKNN